MDRVVCSSIRHTNYKSKLSSHHNRRALSPMRIALLLTAVGLLQSVVLLVYISSTSLSPQQQNTHPASAGLIPYHRNDLCASSTPRNVKPMQLSLPAKPCESGSGAMQLTYPNGGGRGGKGSSSSTKRTAWTTITPDHIAILSILLLFLTSYILLHLRRTENRLEKVARRNEYILHHMARMVNLHYKDMLVGTCETSIQLSNARVTKRKAFVQARGAGEYMIATEPFTQLQQH